MQTITTVSKKVSRGFTLLELLIVIAILAILAAVVIIVLNPAETLKQARDSQRLSDLSTIKSALSLYLTTVTSPSLDNGKTDNNSAAPHCFGGTTTPSGNIWYSKETSITSTAVPAVIGTDVGSTPGWETTGYNTISAGCGTAGGCFVWVNSGNSGATSNYTVGNIAKVDGTGWIPVKLTDTTGGSALSNLPLDPTNSVTAAGPVNTDLVYRYSCIDTSTGTGLPSSVFEIDAQLESTKYTSTTDLRKTDGGDNNAYYETGTSLRILPTGNDF